MTTQKDHWNRRKFLKGASALAAFGIIQPALVRGSQANSRIKVGVVGLGSRGKLIISKLIEHSGYEIVSVADYFDEISKSVGGELGISESRCHSGLLGYQGVIQDGVEAIFLETPPCFFPEHVRASVEGGCHVFVAKPIAVDVPGCLAVKEAGQKARQNKQVLLVDFQKRTDPYIMEVVKRCHEGLLGELSLVSSQYCCEGFADFPKTETIESRLQKLVWFNDVEIGGGALVNGGIHAIDAALWLAGSNPVSAMGSGKMGREDKYGNTLDVYSITYQLANGVLINHHGEHLKNIYEFVCRCFAYGRDGYAETNYVGKAWLRGNRGGYRGGEVENLYQEGIVRNLKEFETCIREGRYDNVTVEPSVNSTLAAILGREAAQRGGMVTMEQMLQKNKMYAPDLTGLQA